MPRLVAVLHMLTALPMLGARRAALVLLVMGIAAGLALPTTGQAQATRYEAAPQPPTQTASASRLDPTATLSVPAVDAQALRTEHAGRADTLAGASPSRRFAEPHAVSLSAAASGTWTPLSDGRRVWRYRIHAPGAQSINLGFSRFHLPEGGELYLYRPGYRHAVGPFTPADHAPHGELWTPILPGDTVVLEAVVPAGQVGDVQLVLGRVNRGFRDVAPLRSSSPSSPSPRSSSTESARAAETDAAKSGACNVDVACTADARWRDVARAVGVYSLNGIRLCTGTLVNNTREDATPYFLTADHCGVTAENAASMVVYWNYQQPYCRPPDTPPSGDEDEGTLDAFSSGAVLRARNGFGRRSIAGRPDVSLVELDDPLDPSLNLYFAGWNRGLSPPARSTTIHHPQTLEKRISFDYDPARVTAYQPEATSADTTHLRVVDWDRGTTEAGSSGAPLFDDRERVVGVLSGGFAACGNDQSDWYGRFAVGWDAGDRPDARLRDWLAPDGQNPKTLGGMPLRAGTQLAFFDASVSGRAVQLSWQVARADGDADQFLLEQAPAGDGASFQPVTTRPASPDRSRIYSYRVADLPVGTYRFRLQQVGPDGSRTMLDSIRAQVTLQEPVFLRAAPNPVRTSATVRFAVQATQPVQVGLFDALGRRVRTVFDEQLTAQTEARRTLSVEGLASGVYFLRLRTPDQQAVRRITVVR